MATAHVELQAYQTPYGTRGFVQVIEKNIGLPVTSPGEPFEPVGVASFPIQWDRSIELARELGIPFSFIDHPFLDQVLSTRLNSAPQT